VPKASVPARPCEAQTPVHASCFLFPLRLLPPPIDLVLRVELFGHVAVSVHESPSTPKDSVPHFIRDGFAIACVFSVVFAACCAARQSAPEIFLLLLDEIFMTCALASFS
jgi:hypothetical protein